MKKLLLLVGMATINVMSIYAVYRLGTAVYTNLLVTNWASSVVVIIFFLAEIYIIINGIIYFYNVLWTSEYQRIFVKFGKRIPEVTVFLPMRNEPLEVITKTFRACSYLDYPKMKIVVVDSSDIDGHFKKVKKLAESFGITYFQTPYPRHGAKAGAMNEALKVFKTPYFVVFDADYRPSRDFLKLVVPIIDDDPELAFVQTPQFYGNHSESVVSRISQIQQSIFYEYISESKSIHNAMFMCGTNLIVRRKALDSIGGWDETVITEDFMTSMNLMIKGWKSYYYNFATAFGDGPINLTQFFKQQYRWSKGTFDSFRKNFFKLINPFSELKWMQKVEYTLSGIYFFVGFIWLIMIFMPILYLFFGIPGYKTDPLLFTVVYFPYFLLSFLFFLGSLRYRNYKISDMFKAQSLTFLTLPSYTKAFIDSLFHIKSEFVTVKKSGDVYEVPWKGMKFQVLLIILNITATFYGLYQLPQAIETRYAIMSNIFWTTFHTFVLLYFIISLYVEKYKKAY